MAYKKISDRIIGIDELSGKCGMFYSNEKYNGYGCRSKSKHKQIPGACYAFDCPLGCEADEQDYIDLGIDQSEFDRANKMVRQFLALTYPVDQCKDGERT